MLHSKSDGKLSIGDKLFTQIKSMRLWDGNKICPIELDKWYHVAIVKASSKELKFYLNGGSKLSIQSCYIFSFDKSESDINNSNMKM
jgi:hypothetical protein